MGRKYIEESWTIEHPWDCGHCRTRNPGRNDKCWKCGKPIDSTHNEIVPDDMSSKNKVTDTSIFNDTRPDWFCGYCPSGTRNRASRETCNECGARQGAKKGEAASGQDTTKGSMVIKSNVRTTVNEKGEPIITSSLFKLVPIELPPRANVTIEASKGSTISNVKVSGSGTLKLQATGGSEIKNVRVGSGESLSFSSGSWLTPERQDSMESVFKVALPILLVAILVALGIYLLSWHKTVARVQETAWHYHVSLHSRTVMVGHDWRNNEPAHSFAESCHAEIRSYHNCHPYNCNPHQVPHDCHCHPVTRCNPHTTCQNVCTNRGNRSSSCHRECETDDGCVTRNNCDVCYQTEYDTCHERCPDYDQMCDFQYPAWGETNHADTSQMDHNIVRPALDAPGNMICPSDEETLFIQNSEITSCTQDSLTFRVNWDAGEDGHYGTVPQTASDYHRFVTGRRWNAQYNHAGQFEPLNPL